MGDVPDGFDSGRLRDKFTAAGEIPVGAVGFAALDERFLPGSVRSGIFRSVYKASPLRPRGFTFFAIVTSTGGLVNGTSFLQYIDAPRPGF